MVGVSEGQSSEIMRKGAKEEVVNNGAKFLEILIFKCEADWAYGMDMKKAISLVDGKSKNNQEEESKIGLKNQSLLQQRSVHASRNPNRLRAHTKKRFFAAFKLTKHL